VIATNGVLLQNMGPVFPFRLIYADLTQWFVLQQTQQNQAHNPDFRLRANL